MFWVIQDNVANEESYEAFIEAVGKLYDYQIVKVIPFSHELVPDINPPKPTMVYGSTTLCQRIAPRKGWKVFTNENFDFTVWRNKWEGHILNEDATIGTFRKVELPKVATEFFIRPVKDNKAFSGTVMDFFEYQTWLGRLFMNESASDLDFDLDEIVMISSVKQIYQETRFWVVDGKIATHSMYKLGDKVQYHDESMTDPEAIKFVENMIDMWVPIEAFVLDVAYTDNGYKVLEINTINSAGLYKANVYKLVDAFSQLKVS